MVNRRSQSGYSLTEVLLVLGIMTIILAISIPAMGQYMRSYSARVGADEFISHMRLARHLAIARHKPVSFQIAARSYSLPDWNSADIAVAPDKTFELPGAVSVVSGTGTVTFRPDGTVATGSTSVRLEIALDGQITARYDLAVASSGKVTTTYTKVTS